MWMSAPEAFGIGSISMLFENISSLLDDCLQACTQSSSLKGEAFLLAELGQMLLVLALVLLSPEDVKCQDDNTNNEISSECVDKVMLVDELEWEHKIKCHHTYEKNCFQTFVTSYRAQREIECHNDYEKNCFIEYKKSSRVVEVRVCHKPFVRNCGKTGPNVCTDEYQTVCETTINEHLVDDDVPACETVYEEICDDDQEGETECQKIPRQICSLIKEERTRTSHDTKCRRERTRVCGPLECPLVLGEEICQNKTKTVLDDVPHEVCDLVPQEICGEVSRLVPKLVPTTKCVSVPREVCVRFRVNPRTVKKPVVKTWCSDQNEPL